MTRFNNMVTFQDNKYCTYYTTHHHHTVNVSVTGLAASITFDDEKTTTFCGVFMVMSQVFLSGKCSRAQVSVLR